jgi:hypothetical protein
MGSLLGRAAVVILLLALAWLHFASKIAFVTADLGRHVRNGELFVKTHQILSTNLYSYTHPDFPAICHHWGAGVLFYMAMQWGGFIALSAFYAAILLLTFVLSMAVSRRSAGFWPTVLAAVVALPLVGYRIEIRPEGLTTLFLAVEFLLLNEWRDKRVSARWLWAIPAIQLVWINVHILFMTGFVFLTFFIIDAFVNDTDRSRWKHLTFVGAVSSLVSLVNPFGLEGLLEPFNIFRVYGYQLAENQTVFFMMKRFEGHAIYVYFLVLLAISFILLGLRLFKERQWRLALLDILILGFFGLMGVKAIRAFSMFGFFFIPLAAIQLAHVIRLYGRPWQEQCRRGVVIVAASFVVLAAVSPHFFLSPFQIQGDRLFLNGEEEKYRKSLFPTLLHPVVWGGLKQYMEGSAAFFRDQGLRGPIFNNYDIGGYLIYYLFPQEKLFVDNRPEAYPVDFFAKVYGPMQEDENVWQETDRKYGFQVIYFYRHDQTTWAQPFLIRRLDDPAWAPVFVDGYTIIFVKRGGVNKDLVAKFELPRSIFGVSKNKP